jgi:hypothetical protein
MLRRICVLGLVSFLGCGGASTGVGPPTTTAPPLPYTPPTLPTTSPPTTVAIGTGSCDMSPAHTSAGPPKVTGVVGRPGGGSRDATVEWDPSTAVDVGCYRVYRALAEAGRFDLRGAVPVRGTTILTPPPGSECGGVACGPGFFFSSRFSWDDDQFDPPVPDHCCFYRVAAVDDAGNEGPPSDVVCSETPIPPGRPSRCPN